MAPTTFRWPGLLGGLEQARHLRALLGIVIELERLEPPLDGFGPFALLGFRLAHHPARAGLVPAGQPGLPQDVPEDGQRAPGPAGPERLLRAIEVLRPGAGRVLRHLAGTWRLRRRSRRVRQGVNGSGSWRRFQGLWSGRNRCRPDASLRGRA